MVSFLVPLGSGFHFYTDSVSDAGGCYGLPAMPGHVTFNVESQQRLAKQGKPYSFAMLEYSQSRK